MGNSTKTARIFEGTVISNAMDKTVVVLYKRHVINALGKHVIRKSKMHAHDEENACAIGDTVQLVQTRPYSKTKTWAVLKIINTKDQA